MNNPSNQGIVEPVHFVPTPESDARLLRLGDAQFFGLWERRLNRLQKFIELNAPDFITDREAALCEQCLRINQLRQARA